MKKLTLVLSALILISPLCTFAKPAKKEKTLVEQGLSLIELMKEKANNEAYIGMLIGSSANSVFFEKIKELGSGDISNLACVYCLSGDYSDFVLKYLSGIEELGMPYFGTDPSIKDSFSPELWNDLKRKVFFALPSIWNLYAGANSLEMAAPGVLSASSNFDSDEIDSDCIYIFTFSDSYPVAVSFQRGEGRSVYASASFVLDRDFPKSLEAMQELGFDVQLEKVKF